MCEKQRAVTDPDAFSLGTGGKGSEGQLPGLKDEAPSFPSFHGDRPGLWAQPPLQQIQSSCSHGNEGQQGGDGDGSLYRIGEALGAEELSCLASPFFPLALLLPAPLSEARSVFILACNLHD